MLAVGWPIFFLLFHFFCCHNYTKNTATAFINVASRSQVHGKEFKTF